MSLLTHVVYYFTRSCASCTIQARGEPFNCLQNSNFVSFVQYGLTCTFVLEILKHPQYSVHVWRELYGVIQLVFKMCVFSVEHM